MRSASTVSTASIPPFFVFLSFLWNGLFSVSRDAGLAHQASSMYPRFPPSVGSGADNRLRTCTFQTANYGTARI